MKYTNEQLKALSEALKKVSDGVQLTPELAEELQEYEEVQKLPWEEAAENCRFMMDEALQLGPTGYFYFKGCLKMLARYEKGERTRELFDEMMALH